MTEKLIENLKTVWPTVGRYEIQDDTPENVIESAKAITKELYESFDAFDIAVEQAGGFIETDDTPTLNEIYMLGVTHNSPRHTLSKLDETFSLLKLTIIDAPTDPNHPDYRHDVAKSAMELLVELMGVFRTVGVPPHWYVPDVPEELNTCKEC